MTSRGRRLALVCCALILTLQACSSNNDPAPETPSSQGTESSFNPPLEPLAGFDQDRDGFYTYDEFAEAVRLTVPQYDWPDGMVITSDLVLYQSPGSGSMESDRFGIGMERDILGIWHACAWITAWQNGIRTSDQELQTEARGHFADYIDAQVKLGMDPDSQDYLRGIVESAELDDPSRAQGFIAANCVFLTGYPWTGSDIASPPSPQASTRNAQRGRSEL